MLLRCRCINEHVVDGNEDSGVEKVVEDVIHQSLEGRWGVHQPEGHHGVLELSIFASGGCLPPMPLCHPNQVETGLEVDCGRRIELLASDLACLGSTGWVT